MPHLEIYTCALLVFHTFSSCSGWFILLDINSQLYTHTILLISLTLWERECRSVWAKQPVRSLSNHSSYSDGSERSRYRKLSRRLEVRQPSQEEFFRDFRGIIKTVTPLVLDRTLIDFKRRYSTWWGASHSQQLIFDYFIFLGVVCVTTAYCWLVNTEQLSIVAVHARKYIQDQKAIYSISDYIIIFSWLG